MVYSSLRCAGLKPSISGMRAGDDDAHRVGHVIALQRLGDAALDDAARVQDLHRVAELRPLERRFFLGLFFCHSFPS